MIITFIGHRSVIGVPDLDDRIQNAILQNLSANEPIYFYCGGYGEFDRRCAIIAQKCKACHPQSETVFITPYLTLQQQKKINEYLAVGLYDCVLYPPLENTPPKYAIVKRNEWMIAQADVVIAYVNQTFGGAYRSLQYAKRKNKRIINLA